MAIRQKITPYLWFDGKAEEAANFYISIFGDSKIIDIVRHAGGAPGEAAGVTTVVFQLEGQTFVGFDGGPLFKFTEAVSFFIDCATQAELDRIWDRLSEGGQIQQCGWLKDRFGLSWQVNTLALERMLLDRDPARARRVMEAVLAMKKIDIAALERAYEGR